MNHGCQFLFARQVEGDLWEQVNQAPFLIQCPVPAHLTTGRRGRRGRRGADSTVSDQTQNGSDGLDLGGSATNRCGWSGRPVPLVGLAEEEAAFAFDHCSNPVCFNGRQLPHGTLTPIEPRGLPSLLVGHPRCALDGAFSQRRALAAAPASAIPRDKNTARTTVSVHVSSIPYIGGQSQ